MNAEACALQVAAEVRFSTTKTRIFARSIKATLIAFGSVETYPQECKTQAAVVSKQLRPVSYLHEKKMATIP